MTSRADALAERLHRLGPVGRRGARAVDRAAAAGPAELWRARRDARRPSPGPGARDAVYARIWSAAAAAVGAQDRPLGSGFRELVRGGRRTVVRHQLTALDDGVALALALDKGLSARLLVRSGVPVPEQRPFRLDDDGAAVSLLERAGRVVVKPAAGTAGGEGVTAGVATPSALRRAARHASRWGPELVAEPHVDGLLHRVLLLDGEVLDVVVDVPPSVLGDGRSSVRALVQAENARRRSADGGLGLEVLDVDLDLVLALADQGLAPGSVVEAGRRVRVKTVTNDRGPADSTTLRTPVHPEVAEACRTAAAAIGLRLAGVDVIAPGLDAPLPATGGVVLEVNGAPGLHRHYQVAEAARATPVAEPVLERLLSG